MDIYNKIKISMKNLNEEINRSRKLMGLDEAIDWANVKHQTGFSCTVDDLHREAVKFASGLSKSANVEKGVNDYGDGGEYVQISFQHDIPRIGRFEDKLKEVQRAERAYTNRAKEFFGNFCEKGVRRVGGMGGPSVSVNADVYMMTLESIPNPRARYGQENKVIQIDSNSTKPEEYRGEQPNVNKLGQFEELRVYITLFLN